MNTREYLIRGLLYLLLAVVSVNAAWVVGGTNVLFGAIHALICVVSVMGAFTSFKNALK